jgi:hypothetical protein
MRRPAPCFRRPACALAVAAVLLALAACSSAPPRVYAPLHYDYLTPLRLNVASVTVESRFVPGGPNDLNPQDPAPLVPTLTAMAQDRLQAVGSTGRAVFVIKDASLSRVGDGINASMDVELDVYAGGGTRAGFAEARVSRFRSGDGGDLQATLYDMTKQLMDAMNIEFEYQVRRSLKDWLAPSSAAPAPVQQQALPPPGATAPPAPVSTLAPPAPSSTLAPPTQTLVPPALPSRTLPVPAPSGLAAPTPYAAPYPSPYPAPAPYPSNGLAPTRLVPPGSP